MVTDNFTFSTQEEQNLKTIASNSLNSLSHALFAEVYSSKNDILYKNLIAIPNRKIKNFIKNSFITDLQLDCFTNLHFSSLYDSLLTLASNLTSKPLIKTNRYITLLHLLHELKKSSLQKQISINTLTHELNDLLHQDPLERKSSPYDPTLHDVSQHYPLIKTLASLINNIDAHSLSNYSLHIFAPFSLTPLYQKCILHLSNFIPTTLYFLSPTKKFWTDLLSPSENHYIQKQSLKKGIKPSELLTFSKMHAHASPILASFGAAGRDLFSNLFLCCSTTQEFFEDKDPSSPLEHVRYELLHQEKSSQPIVNNGSISAFSACTKREEIEELYLQISKLLSTGIKPHEILVIAPNINDYAHFIESIFTHQYNFQIFDVSNNYNIDSSLLPLFNLINERFSIDALFTLLNHPQFKLPFELKAESLSLFKQILKHKKFTWGFNANFKKKNLDPSMCTASNTWQEVVEDLLECAAYTESTIPFSELEPFGKFLLLVQNLYHDLEKIRSTTKPIILWIKDYKQLLEKYLKPHQEMQQFIAWIFSLKPLHLSLPKALFSYEELSYPIDQFFKQERKSIKNRPSQGITFHSLQEGIITPHQAVFFIGLDEEAFPRKPLLSPYIKPTILQNDKDRYQILLALLMAKTKLSFSYVRISKNDHQEQKISHFVRELCSSVTIQIKHLSPFSYPQQASNFSYSALSIPSSTHNTDETINIFELNTLVTNPLKFFANKALNIHLSTPITSQEEIFPSYLEHTQLRNQLITQKLDSLPISTSSPLFKQYTLNRLKNEAEDFHTALNKYNLTVNQLLTISLEPTCKAIYQEEKTLFVPSPIITINTTNYCIKGSVKLASTEGLVLFKSFSPQETIKNWATQILLLYLSQAHQHFPISPNMIYLKSNKTSPTPSSSPETLLKELLNYFLLAKNTPSPLFPEYACSYLINKDINYKKAEEKNSLIVCNPYNQLLQPNHSINWREHLPCLCNILTA